MYCCHNLLRNSVRGQVRKKLISRHRHNNYQTAICKVISLTRGHSPRPLFRISVCLHATTLSTRQPVLLSAHAAPVHPHQHPPAGSPVHSATHFRTHPNKIVSLNLSLSLCILFTTLTWCLLSLFILAFRCDVGLIQRHSAVQKGGSCRCCTHMDLHLPVQHCCLQPLLHLRISRLKILYQ